MHEDLLERLAAVPVRVAEITAGLDEEALRRRPAEGEWSMKEVCGHLVVDARTWRDRVALALRESDPYWERLDPVDTVGEGGYQDAPLEQTLGEFRRVRRQMVENLSLLSDDGWQRTGRHWSEGRMTLIEACEVALEHAESHLEQLREVRRKATA